MPFGYPTSWSNVNNNFTIGQQVELVLVAPDGTTLQNFGLLTEFQATAEVHLIEVHGINNGGYVARRNAQQGWKGTFSFARANGLADFIQYQEELSFYGGNPQNFYSILETFQNPDLSLSVYQFLGVVISGFDAGTVRQNAEVPQRLEFAAAQRLQLQGPQIALTNT